MRLLAASVATGLALCAGGAARADEMYRWLDAQGGVHSGSEPPADARSVAPWSPDSGRLKIEPQAAPDEAAPATAVRPTTTAEVPPPAARAEEGRIGGRTETEWRRGARQLEDRIRDLEQKLDEVEDSTHAYGGWGTHRGADGLSQGVSVPDPRKQLAKDLRHTESELDAFEEEARRLGVPPGWLR